MMTTLKLIIYAVILLIVVVLGMTFGFRNDAAVTVDLLFTDVSTLGIGVWILLSFVVGSLFGWLVSLPGTIGLKVSSKQRQRKIDRQRDELSRLKGEPSEG